MISYSSSRILIQVSSQKLVEKLFSQVRLPETLSDSGGLHV